jgi:hypothetical protein
MRDLSRVIPCLVMPKFEHSTLIVCVEQLHHSAMATRAVVNDCSKEYFTRLVGEVLRSYFTVCKRS